MTNVEFILNFYDLFYFFISKAFSIVSKDISIDYSTLDILFRFKLHFILLLSAKTQIRELKILHKIALIGAVTSYKLSQELGIPSATVWRLLKKLSREGYIRKEEKGFNITPKGLFDLYRSLKDERIGKLIAMKLKELWNYEGEVDDIYVLLNDISRLIDENKIEIETLCLNSPIPLAGFLFSFSHELSEQSKRVIAYYIIKAFPVVKITPFCKGVISFDENGTPYAIAVNCKVEGLKLNHYCKTIQRLFSIRNHNGSH